MDWTLEVVVVPVSDLAASIAFYRDQVGFDLDHETRNEHMHVAQLTPRGSGCSIVIGDLPSQNQMAPGTLHGLQLVVADAAAARAELVCRGVECSEVIVSTSATAARCSGSPTPTATRGRCSRSAPGPTGRSSRARGRAGVSRAGGPGVAPRAQPASALVPRSVAS